MIYICPIMHPAAIIRGRYADEPAQVVYLERAGMLASGEWVPEDVSSPPSEGVLSPTLPDLTTFGQARGLTEGVTCDIETAGDYLVCIGFARMVDEASICVPFLRQGGFRYWPTWEDHVSAVAWTFKILSDPEIPKVFQNGQAFDIPRLVALGFVVENYAFDTLIAQRYAYPEMAADLAFLGGFYGGIPNWKWLAREEQEGK